MNGTIPSTGSAEPPPLAIDDGPFGAKNARHVRTRRRVTAMREVTIPAAYRYSPRQSSAPQGRDGIAQGNALGRKRKPIAPFQGYTVFAPRTQGVALGYSITPLRG